MNFPLYIAKRYLFSKSSNNAINVITGIAAVGVILGAMSLFIVLSGFSGLKEFSLQFTNIFDSDLKVYPENGKLLTLSENFEDNIKNINGIEASTLVIEERVFLRYRGKNHIAYIKGVDENFDKVNPVDSILYYDNWFTQGKSEIVVGYGIVAKLSLGTYDYGELVEIYVPKPGTGQITDPTNAFRKQNAVVSGIYQVNEDLDSEFVFSDIDYARSLLKLDSNQVSSIELKIDPDVSEDRIRQGLEEIFSEDVLIKNRIQQNDALFKMLNTENLAVYLIVTLVAMIALFNLAGAIIMMILDKKNNIKTLHHLGAKISDIRKVFFLQGSYITLLGTLLGIILAVVIVQMQVKFELVRITSTLAYPVKLTWLNILIVFSTIFIIGIIASKIASSRVREKLIS